jgi:hypothetical protein
VDGRPIVAARDLQQVMSADTIGHRVTATLIRQGRVHELVVIPVELAA